MKSAPLVSVVMANYNAAPHIATAVRSALRQSLDALEVIVSDDGSSDDSLARARAAAAGDSRLVVVEGGPKSGPGAARNRAFAVARGEWIAILDSDDFMHPKRLERLVAAADADKADIVADDMLVFYESGAPAHAHLREPLTDAPAWITPAAYADANHLFAAAPSLGYLKPLFRRAATSGAPIYDERLRVAEDYDLVMRLLLQGARMRVYPDLGYFYRKHSHSISHRLSTADIAAMLAAHDRMTEIAPREAALQRALNRRRASLVDAQVFDAIVNDLKARRVIAALGRGAARPGALALMRYPIFDRLKRAQTSPAPQTPSPTVLLTRQQSADAATITVPAGLSARAAALHVSQRAKPGATRVLFDDAELGALAPYVLSPDAEIAQRP